MKRSDTIIFTLLLLMAYGLGAGYVRAARRTNQWPAMPGLSRRVFGAAAMMACGRGATTPAVPLVAGPDTPAPLTPLIDFLGVRREAIACADIPADVAVDGLDGPQRASRYLLLLAAGTWKLSGPAWSGIDALLGLMFAVSVALAYLVARLGMGRTAAAIVAAFYMLSPMHLANLLDLRDYSKTPFFAAALLVAGLLVVRPRRGLTVIAAAAAAGGLIGFGFGIRTDIALNLIVVLGAIVAFLPGPAVDTWKLRGIAAAVCVCAFAAAAAPILTTGASGSNLWHWALLGYAHESDEALGVAPALYEPGYFYSDSYVATVVDAFWSRTTGSAAQVSVGLSDYTAASERDHLLLLKTFPADALLRGWASVIRVLELPYASIRGVPNGLLPDIVGRAAIGTERVLARGARIGVPLFVLVVLLVSVTSPRLAAGLCAVTVFLGVYPAIQFQPRHVFHLELLSLWILGFAISSAGRLIAGRTDLASGSPWRPVLFAGAMLSVVLLPLAALRTYQQRMATTLFSSYHEARKDPIVMAPAPIGGGDLRAALSPGPGRDRRRSMQSDMLVLEISADGCPAARPALTVRYRATNPAADFSRTYTVARPAAGTRTALYVPAYETGQTNPDPAALAVAGLEAAESDWPCISRVSRFAEPDRFPLLLTTMLAADWRSRPLHQTLRAWESGASGDDPPVAYWEPRHLRARAAAITGRLDHGGTRPAAAIDFRAAIARVDRGESVSVDGVAASTGSYLVAWKPAPASARTVLVARGTLSRGGLTVGWVDAGAWAARVDIASPGPFQVFVQVPRAGSYQVVVANRLDDRSLVNRFTIAHLAVVDDEHE